MTSWHVRVLCDNPWEGGYGYTPQQVGDMTLDQVMRLLMERKDLKMKSRKREIGPLALAAKAGGDGMVRGRAADGSPMRARITGKSKAKQLLEAQQKRKK